MLKYRHFKSVVMVFRRQYEQYAQLKYSDTTERKVEIRDIESMEAFKEGIPEIVLPYTVNVSVSYWTNERLGFGLLGIYAYVPELGARAMFEKDITADTPAHIDSFVENFANTSVELSQKSTRNRPALRAELAGELKEKLRDATKGAIEELVIG